MREREVGGRKNEQVVPVGGGGFDERVVPYISIHRVITPILS